MFKRVIDAYGRVHFVNLTHVVGIFYWDGSDGYHSVVVMSEGQQLDMLESPDELFAVLFGGAPAHAVENK